MFAIFGLSTQAQITFVKTYTNLDTNAGIVAAISSGQQTSDGGYIMVNFDEKGNQTYFSHLIKTNAVGDTLWTRAYANYWGNSVQQTNDGGYIMVGYISTLGDTLGDVYLIKTDSNGDTLWTKCYGSINHVSGFSGYSVKQTNDNGYIIIGSSDSADYGIADLLLIKTNSIGDTLWTKIYGGNIENVAYSIEQTLDGGYIITGYAAGLGPGNVYLIKTDSMGDILWSKTYGNGSAIGNSVKQTSDSGYIIAGSYGQNYLYLIKTNSTGDTLWTKTYFSGDSTNISNYSAAAFSVQQTSDGGYIISGNIFYSFSDATSGGLIKTDSTGTILWTSFFTEVFGNKCTFQQTIDGGYILFAESLIKTDSNGYSGCTGSSPSFINYSLTTNVSITTTIVKSGCIVSNPSDIVVSNGVKDTTICFSVGINEIKTNYYVSLYPNPTSGTFTLSYNSQTPILNSQLKIYDVLGQEVYTQAITNPNQTTINVSQLSNGVYFYQFTKNNSTGSLTSIRGKFVKE